MKDLANKKRQRLSSIAFGLFAYCLAWTCEAELVVYKSVALAAINQIVFFVNPSEMGAFIQIINPQSISQPVADNLSQLGYPVKSKAFDSTSHQLSAIIGSVQTDSTPVGFSFSSGNSDPRAGGFQKAQVLPITCTFSATVKPDPLAIYTTTVSANRFFSGAVPVIQVEDKLSDAISSACLDLLKGLAIQPQTLRESTTPRWMPAVSVEVINVPSSAPVGKPLNTQPIYSQPASALAPVTPPPTKNSPVQPTPTELENPRKQIIIRNQGTPLIFEMGQHRR